MAARIRKLVDRRGIAISIQGLDEAIRVLERLKRHPEKRLKETFRSEAGKILNRAKSLTPVDTGRLRDSGRLIEVKDGIAIAFGGMIVRGVDVDYAVYVHERTDQHHKVGQAKFLDRAVREARGRVGKAISDKMKADIGAEIRREF